MGLEFLASRIKAANAPAKACWWPRHGLYSARFLALSRGGSTEAIRNVRDCAHAHAGAWEAWMPTSLARRWMDRHVAFEMALVEGARRGSKETIERMSDLLVSNAYEQSEDLAAKLPEFPSHKFRGLLMEHTWLFIQLVRQSLERQNAGECIAKSDSNAIALAAFTMEWF